MSSLGENLDATITSAVLAQVDAKVLEAFSGDETLGRMVTAALTKPVKIKDRNNYREVEVPWIEHAVADVIRGATMKAMRVALEEEQANIQDMVRKAVKRRSGEIAEQLTDAVLESSKSDFQFRIEIVPRR